MAKEIEAKIKIDNIVDLRGRLNALGASLEGSANEKNWVFDDESGSLAGMGFLLRVRNLGDVACVLTVKRPTGGGEGFKAREEVETVVDSTRDLLKQLEMLGYSVRWIYEKRRQTWLWRECVISLDECPKIGNYIEIEGLPEIIRRVCQDLGLNPDDHIEDNYLTLWQKHLAARGEPDRNMVFSQAGKDKDDPDFNKLSELLFD